MEKTEVRERTDADRADDRERKRRSRDRQYAARDAERVQSLDLWEARLIETMEKINAEERQPRPVIVRHGPPIPARLPSLEVWITFLKTIQSEAVREEIARVEAAIATGMTEFPRQSEDHHGAT